MLFLYVRYFALRERALSVDGVCPVLLLSDEVKQGVVYRDCVSRPERHGFPGLGVGQLQVECCRALLLADERVEVFGYVAGIVAGVVSRIFGGTSTEAGMDIVSLRMAFSLSVLRYCTSVMSMLK